MWLLIVNPISRGIPKEHLYYFSSEKFEPGDLIEVPLRSRNIVAKVNSVKSVVDAKAELKTLPFAVRKIGTISLPRFFSKSFMLASEITAKYFSSSLGATLYSLLPSKNLLSVLKNDFPKSNTLAKETSSRGVFVLQLPDEERFASYRRMIREEFAKKQSLFIIVPTIAEATTLYKELIKGIESFSFLFHQRLTKQKIAKLWQDASLSTHPIFVVSTPVFIGLPRNDLGTIILERESSEFYKKDTRPFVDFRIFARFYSKEIGAKIIHGDSMIRSEIFEELESNQAYEYDKNSFRSLSSAQTEIVTWSTKDIKQNNEYLSKRIYDLILENKNNGGHVLIFSPRRGLAPRTFCRNCGKTVSCPNCGGTLVLHGENRKSFDESTKYLCHRCGTEIGSAIRCQSCNGWDLIPFGVGSEKIEKEINTLCVNTKVFRIDRDVVKKETDIEKIVQKFLSTPGSVLVGTEILLSRLVEKVNVSIALFPEFLTVTSEYTADEKAFRLLLRVRGLASKNFVIQTTDLNFGFIKQIENSNIAEFFRNELQIRRKLNYPPFSVLILFSWPKSTEINDLIKKSFSDFQPIFFSTWSSEILKEERALIRLRKSDWPSDVLREKILSLPIKVAVEVMPDRIFG